MTDPLSAASEPARLLAQDLIDRIEQLILQAEQEAVPLEVDPQRPRLFQMFAEAEAAGFLADGSPIDLTCDAIARHLADRWNLRDLGQAIAQPTRLPPTQLNRLRVLWSFMRLWMEWTYAWQRWHEFHSPGGPTATNASPDSD
jgi:hypothetical protein